MSSQHVTKADRKISVNIDCATISKPDRNATTCILNHDVTFQSHKNNCKDNAAIILIIASFSKLANI